MTARGLPPDEPAEDPDLAAQWDDIVARLGDLSPADAPDDPPESALPDQQTGGAPGSDDAQPATEAEGEPAADGTGRTTPRRRRTDQPGAHTVRPASGPAESDPRGWAPDEAAEEAEDHFVPPEPGPVLGGDPLITMAWVVVIGAPTLAVVALVAWQDIPTVLLQVAGVAFLAAVGLLLWRMPHRRDEDDDDPGAVV